VLGLLCEDISIFVIVAMLQLDRASASRIFWRSLSDLARASKDE